MRLVLVGATGAVGREIMSLLERRAFPADELVPVASPRSAGRRLSFGKDTVVVRELAADVFEGAEMALFDVPDDVARRWAPVAAHAGAVVVDNSAAWRLEPDVPLVVPEINPSAVQDAPLGIISSPNCTTLAMVLPVAVLHRQASLERLILASYQAVSGVGNPGIDELWEQTELVVKDADSARAGLARRSLSAGRAFGQPIALNVIPQCGSFKDDGYTSEELKLCHETRKILGLSLLPVTATCVRVPVMIGHGVAVHATFADSIDPTRARALLGDAPGIEVMDDPATGRYPTPLEAAGRDPVYVGRIRRDLFDDRSLEMFCVADNLRKGAALNTVQIAELLGAR